MKPRIAILTTLTDIKPAYSLVGVILDQARQLRRKEYQFNVLSLRTFNAADRKEIETEGLPWRFELTQVRDVEYKHNEAAHVTNEKETGFDDQVKLLLDGDPHRGTIGYRQALKDYDVIIDHDIMFLSWFLAENKALRTFMDEHPEKNYLHYVHSAPSQKPEGTCFPSTLRFQEAPGTFIFLNESQRHDCALMMGTTRDKVAVVYNPRDLRDLYNFSEDTNRFLDVYDLFDHELLQIYPFSTPRWQPKGVKQLLTLFGEWKKSKVNARLVLVNCNSNSAVDQPTVQAIKDYATSKGLSIGRDVIFTSDFAAEMINFSERAGNKDEVKKWQGWKYCVPARVIRDLNLLANLFIFPSDTECASLIQGEAAVTGKFMVLNRDFRPMLEFAAPNTLAFEFKINNPDNAEVIKRGYYTCVAREILAEFKNETALINATKARTKTYNRDYIFSNQLEPLIWKGFASRISKSNPKPEGGQISLNYPPSNTVTDTHTQPHPPETVRPVASKWPPQIGDPCPIWETCSTERRTECEKECGRCPLVDEVPTT